MQQRRIDEDDAAVELAPDADAPIPVALVVDDEPIIRQLVSTVLRRRGWTVLEAEDGTVALTVAESEALDLLVTDYEMPVISGLTLAERLRRTDADLPVLMVSGHPEVAHKMRKLHGRRTAFVRKPFPVEELVSSIGAITD
jgi:two-component system OmpR family response regulator